MKLSKIIITMFSSIGICVGCANAQKPAENSNIDVVAPQEFSARLQVDSTACLLDVRRPEEFKDSHLKGANQLNWLDRENFEKGVERLDKAKTIYVYCRSGRRSNEAANYLASKGFKVVDMKGGILAWNQSNLETVK